MEEKDSPIKFIGRWSKSAKRKRAARNARAKAAAAKKKAEDAKKKAAADAKKKADAAAAAKKAAADKVVADKKVADKKAADKAALDKANSLRQDGKTAEAYVPLDQTGRKVPTTTQEATNEAFAEKLKAVKFKQPMDQSSYTLIETARFRR